MAAGQGDAEGLVIHRPDDDAGLLERERDDDHVQFALPQLLGQIDREVLADEQRHVRRMDVQSRNEPGKKVGRDRVDDAHAQRADQGVLALAGNILEALGLLQHPLRLLRDPFPDRGQANVGRGSFEQGNAETRFDLFQRDRKRRLADMAFLRRPPEMALMGQGHDVAKFGKGHVSKDTLR